jgi:hypothetical protein
MVRTGKCSGKMVCSASHVPFYVCFVFHISIPFFECSSLSRCCHQLTPSLLSCTFVSLTISLIWLINLTHDHYMATGAQSTGTTCRHTMQMLMIIDRGVSDADHLRSTTNRATTASRANSSSSPIHQPVYEPPCLSMGRHQPRLRDTRVLTRQLFYSHATTTLTVRPKGAATYLTAHESAAWQWLWI